MQDDKPQAMAGISLRLRTWILVAVALMLIWVALGYVVMR
jgi:hypothetical protein